MMKALGKDELISGGIRTLLNRELEDGETILWTGQPELKVFVRVGDWWLWALALVWEFITLSLMFSAWRDMDPGYHTYMVCGGVFYLIWLLLPVWLVVEYHKRQVRKRRWTYYLLTSQRALIYWLDSDHAAQKVRLATVSEIQFSERPDGSGTIVFGTLPTQARFTWEQLKDGRLAPFMFERIPDSRAVFKMALLIQLGLAGGEPERSQ